MSAILVTGGAGFIGSHVMDHLLARGDRVVAIDDFCDHYSPAIKRYNLAGALKHPGFTLVEGDIRDLECLETVFQKYDVRRVVHLAARAGVRSLESPLVYQDINIRGTMNVLEACRARGVDNVLVASSSSVYGNTARVPFHEDDPADRPISPYAATKRSVELLCHTYHHLYDLPISCFRFFTVYGPRQRPDMGFHIFTRLTVAGEPIQMFGDGSTQRDYTYISDIVDGLVTALDRPQAYEVVNLGNTHTVRLSRALELVQKALGRDAVIEARPEHPRDVRLTNADISKANRLYGYAPKVDVEEGIPRFVEWYLKAKEDGVL
ncbi:MAG: GDP-mannose 4,6-dehydratase [bacterium]|nr:GDP-mannose 4,6-dehydratase [bacterium]